MRKIKGNIKKSSRVTIVRNADNINFYYQDNWGRERDYLYSMKYSPSVMNYFGKNGKTIDELYQFKKWNNHKLSKLIERLPKVIEYVIKEREDMEYGY